MQIFNSDLSIAEIVENAKSFLDKNNIKIFAIFDHKTEADLIGLSVEDVKIIVFGDPKVGTLLMQENIKIAIDLPLKLMIYKESGATKIAYKDSSLLQKEYDIINNKAVVAKMDQFMLNFVRSIK